MSKRHQFLRKGFSYLRGWRFKSYKVSIPQKFWWLRSSNRNQYPAHRSRIIHNTNGCSESWLGGIMMEGREQQDENAVLLLLDLSFWHDKLKFPTCHLTNIYIVKEIQYWSTNTQPYYCTTWVCSQYTMPNTIHTASLFMLSTHNIALLNGQPTSHCTALQHPVSSDLPETASGSSWNQDLVLVRLRELCEAKKM